MPPVVARLLHDQRLEAVATFRNGPRFWVGHVTDGAREFVLKMVTDNTPWINPLTEVGLYPSDKLRVETTVWRQFGLLERSSPQGATWHMRPFQPGQSMSEGAGPFLFRNDFFQPARLQSTLEFIRSYQLLTPNFAGFDALAPTSLEHHLSLGPASQPCPELAPYVPAIRAYMGPRLATYDAAQTVLGHREVYPPHIFFAGSDVGLIDWENARLSTPQADYAAVWVRSFAQPEAQGLMLSWLRQNNLVTTPAQQELWNLDVLAQANGNLNYLSSSPNEPAAVRQLAMERLVSYIEAILDGKPLTAM